MPNYSAFLHFQTKEERDICVRDEELIIIKDCYCVPEPAHDPVYLIINNLKPTTNWKELVEKFKEMLIPELNDKDPIDHILYEEGWTSAALKFCNKSYCSKAKSLLDGYRYDDIVIRTDMNTQRNIDAIFADNLVTQVCITGLPDTTTPSVYIYII